MINLKTYKWGCCILTSWRHGWRLPFFLNCRLYKYNIGFKLWGPQLLQCLKKKVQECYILREYFIVKCISQMLNNDVLHHITSHHSNGRVLTIWSYDNWLQPHRPPAHFPTLHYDTGLSWALEAHLLRTEVPKPQFQELPSLLALPTLPQALISLHTPFFACLLLKEEPAGFNVCIYLVRRHQFGLMQNLCYHTGLLMIFKEEKVC